MTGDLTNWSPLTIKEINDIFSKMTIWWAIAGGWALDLHMGHQSRVHTDLDIVVNRKDQVTVYGQLRQDWLLFKAKDGELTPWDKGEALNDINSLWVKKNITSPWAFEIMLMDSENDEWIYRRETFIRRQINDIYLTSDTGIPYLRPEIQLLYKLGSSQVREKDYEDYYRVKPLLLPCELEWLEEALATQLKKR